MATAYPCYSITEHEDGLFRYTVWRHPWPGGAVCWASTITRWGAERVVRREIRRDGKNK